MKAKIKAMMNVTDEDRRRLAEWLTFAAVRHIIGKGSTTIHRLIKEGTLKQIGRRSSARISLKSVLEYIEQQRGIAQVAATIPNTSIKKAQQFAHKKREEIKLARALEIVNAAQPAGNPSNPTGDPRFEAVVFRGVCMAACERDQILDAEYRAQANRRYVFSSMRGI